MKRTFTALAAVALFGGAAYAQDSESLVIDLSGEVDSNCELVPEGSASFDVDMLETGNQGSLAIAYSCNSPYEVTLQSLYGGMRHDESGGAVVIDYDIEHFGFDQNGLGGGTVNSASMQATAAVIASSPNWENILTNGGIRTGNMDLSFDSLNEYAVAGTYEDELTLTLTAIL
ncbi:hypothetical protein [Henriciella sp.]|uniref:hypothetical protein n=1 Tax=Henriciella sp. TaxID=1968823 RepID=UPI002628F4C0|nr:hypothetical protein [Henriciella sp.]